MSNEKIESSEQFQARCEKLMTGIKMMNVMEENGAVWCAVIASVLVQTFFASENPDESCESFVRILKKLVEIEKESEKKPEEK